MSTTATDIVVKRLPELASVEQALTVPAGSLKPTGLDLGTANVDFDTWASWGHTLGFLSGWSRWAIGDWLLWGENAFGEAEASQVAEGTPSERYDVANRVTGLKVTTLQNYVSLCARIPIDRRRVELDFGVHGPVSALDADEQVYWLNQAVENAWTREELRDAIKEAKRDPTKTGDDGGQPVTDPPLSIGERIEHAARLCWNQAQPTSEGGALVPPEAWHQLAEALGEE